MSILNTSVESLPSSAIDTIRYTQAMEQLVVVVQSLSTVRDLESVMEIVRIAARDLTQADGATFVLREGDLCHYVEENAIQPLWKGRRFPMETCISGWAMLNRQAAVIEDIYQDDRIPQDTYKPTFVKSLVMVPIRTCEPIGAIGNYWAEHHQPSIQEIKLLQALADATAVAIENIQLYSHLERKVEERTAQWQAVNHELETFSYSVSHDLRAPIRAIDGFSQVLLENYVDALDEKGKTYLSYVRSSCQHMNQLIEDMLQMSRLTQWELRPEDGIHLSEISERVIADLKRQEPQRQVQVVIQPGLLVKGDRHLLESVLQNLLGNAWKYSSKRELAQIEFGQTEQEGQNVFYVKDNGAGFDLAHASKLFAPFQRFHRQEDFPGTGVGLATVQRIIRKHGGKIWAETVPDQGATFYFTLS